MVEEDHAVVILEFRSYEPPHVLIGPEAMREHERASIGDAGQPHMVAAQDVTGSVLRHGNGLCVGSVPNGRPAAAGW
jgi:hypothetical protein